MTNVCVFSSSKKKDPETGEDMVYTRLHLLYPEGADERVKGCKVDSVFCPREVDKRTLYIGKKYELEYALRNYGGQVRAVLVDLHRVQEQQKAG